MTSLLSQCDWRSDHRGRPVRADLGQEQGRHCRRVGRRRLQGRVHPAAHHLLCAAQRQRSRPRHGRRDAGGQRPQLAPCPSLSVLDEPIYRWFNNLSGAIFLLPFC
jgi:hypothetical protein